MMMGLEIIRRYIVNESGVGGIVLANKAMMPRKLSAVDKNCRSCPC